MGSPEHETCKREGAHRKKKDFEDEKEKPKQSRASQNRTPNLARVKLDILVERGRGAGKKQEELRRARAKQNSNPNLL